MGDLEEMVDDPAGNRVVHGIRNAASGTQSASLEGFELGLRVSGAKGDAVITHVAIKDGDFFCERELVVQCGYESELVSVPAELQLGSKCFCDAWSQVEAGISAAFGCGERNLETLVDELAQQTKKNETKLLLPAPFAPMRTLMAESSKSRSDRMDLNPSIDRRLIASLIGCALEPNRLPVSPQYRVSRTHAPGPLPEPWGEMQRRIRSVQPDERSQSSAAVPFADYR